MIKFVSLVFFVSLPWGWADASSELDTFRRALKEYRPGASWICTELMHLPADEAVTAFEEVVSLLIHSQTRWAYFCDSEEQYLQDDYSFRCLAECLYYDRWLQATFVDDGTYLTARESSDVQPLLQLKGRAQEIYCAFYAFLLDCCSDYFMRLLCAAYAVRGTDECKSFSRTAQTVLAKMKRSIIHLKKSDLYAHYHAMLLKYQEVLHVLSQDDTCAGG